MPVKIGVCAYCGETKKIVSRKLCNPCYRAYLNGKIKGNFPVKYKKKRIVTKSKPTKQTAIDQPDLVRKKVNCYICGASFYRKFLPDTIPSKYFICTACKNATHECDEAILTPEEIKKIRNKQEDKPIKKQHVAYSEVKIITPDSEEFEEIAKKCTPILEIENKCKSNYNFIFK